MESIKFWVIGGYFFIRNANWKFIQCFAVNDWLKNGLNP